MTPFDAASRRQLLDEYAELVRRINALESPRPLHDREQAELAEARKRRVELRSRYAAGLPNVPLARCPFDQQIYAPPFDAFGLDGLWWNYFEPVRRHQDSPPYWLALRGAARLGQPVESRPWLCSPGPGAPFVYPRLLEQDSVRAVVSGLRAGPHVLYPVVYFASDWPSDSVIPNLWGTDAYQFQYANGSPGWMESFDTPADWDFELDKWIRNGKLLWTAMDDPGMSLMSSVDGCPYLALDGPRQEQRIYGGAVETGEPEEEETTL